MSEQSEAPNKHESSTAETSDGLSILVKLSGGNQFTLSNISPMSTVLQVKEKAEPHCNIPVQQQRLIYRGRILKDPSTLREVNVENGHTMHLVRSGAAPAGISTTTPATDSSSTSTTATTSGPSSSGARVATEGSIPNPTVTTSASTAGGVDPLMQMMMGMGGAGGMIGGRNPGMMGGGGGMPGGMQMDPQLFQQMMSNPMMSNIIQDMMSNPEILRSLTQSNPMLQQFAQGNPMLQQILSDPQTLQAALQFNQALAQQATRQGAATNSTSATTTTTSATTTTSTTDTAGNTSTSTATMPPVFMMGIPMPAPASTATGGGASMPAMTPGVTGTNAEGQPNFMQTMLQQMQNNPQLMAQMMGALGGAGGAGLPGMGGPALNTNSATLYANELTQLQEMGFIDQELNIQALQQTNGDVNAAISRLLERGLGN